MKALVKRNSTVGLWLEDVPKPEMGINDVLIKIKRTAICGTDMHIYNWDSWAQETIPVPMVVGHEFVGEIVDVGLGFEGFRRYHHAANGARRGIIIRLKIAPVRDVVGRRAGKFGRGNVDVER